jgi:hypothetical protein
MIMICPLIFQKMKISQKKARKWRKRSRNNRIAREKDLKKKMKKTKCNKIILKKWMKKCQIWKLRMTSKKLLRIITIKEKMALKMEKTPIKMKMIVEKTRNNKKKVFYIEFRNELKWR